MNRFSFIVQREQRPVDEEGIGEGEGEMDGDVEGDGDGATTAIGFGVEDGRDRRGNLIAVGTANRLQVAVGCGCCDKAREHLFLFCCLSKAA